MSAGTHEGRWGLPIGIGLLLAGIWSGGTRAPGAPGPGPAGAASTPIIEGVLFAPECGTLYAPARELGNALGTPVRWDGRTQTVYFEDHKIPETDRRALPDGSQAVRLRSLATGGTEVTWDAERDMALVRRGETSVWVRRGRRTVTDAITFADTDSKQYAPARELAKGLGWRLRWDGKSEQAYLNDQRIPAEHLRPLPDGTQLAAVSSLTGWGAKIDAGAAGGATRVSYGEREVWVTPGSKRVAVNLSAQELRAWEGPRLVLETRISSGRKGMETPKGSFKAGPLKKKMLISRLYNDAEMPWSVQVRGDIVIHGYPSVPPRAASHGCVRLPLTGANPARWFYYWVDRGTPIEIGDDWPA